MRIWHRSRARIRGMRSGGACPETPTTRSSPAIRLPDIVEMIIAHLVYDKHSLLACSLTCYSWYLAAVPHLHHTLTAQTLPRGEPRKTVWHKPLLRTQRLGSLPLVKKLHIHEHAYYEELKMSQPAKLHHCIPRLSALTNLQELGIVSLDIHKLILRLRRRFGYFLPTLRSLSLRDPKGSHRQIIYFIGLFQHLEDLKLLFNRPMAGFQEEPLGHRTPAPPFAPLLRGRLAMMFSKAELLKVVIETFAGLRFHSVDLIAVGGIQLLLGTCAGSLETLQLCQNGERLPPRGTQS